MEWQERLRADASFSDFGDFSHLYHVGLTPLVPPEYDIPGIVGLTFRLQERPRGGHVYVTTIDVGAAMRLGERMGLDPAEALAMVDSHERVHIEMQLAGVAEEVEEAQSTFADAVWLSLRHEKAAERLQAGEFGLVTKVGPGFWEALLDR
ncbi:MAG: hypothetical protein HY556_08290 [Euryarchaeota archaeon]|nr:hypothetical protein [Euryarchaeota archaeon]